MGDDEVCGRRPRSREPSPSVLAASGFDRSLVPRLSHTIRWIVAVSELQSANGYAPRWIALNVGGLDLTKFRP